MNGKRLLGIVLAISSIALLVAAVSAAAPTAKRGGTFVFEIATDVDYIDPQLSYYGETWKLEAATACKLMNWQDKEGAAGAVATPEVAAGPPGRLARRQDVHVHDQAGLPVLERQGRDRAELRRRVQPLREPADAVDRRAVPRHRPGRPGRDRRQGADDLGRPGAGQQVRRAPDEGVAGLPRPPDDAVHAGDRHDLAGQIDANGINQYASCGPYYFSNRTPGRSITLKRNPYYKGGRAANVDTIQVNVGNDIAVQFQNVEKGTSDYASTGIPPTEWKNVVQKYGLNRKDGRVQVRRSSTSATWR